MSPETAFLEGAYGKYAESVDTVLQEVRTRDTPPNAGRRQWQFNVLATEVVRLRALLAHRDAGRAQPTPDPEPSRVDREPA